MNDTTQKPLVRLAERAEQLADEFRVRAHLATAEAKQAWDRAHLERIADELANVRDEAGLQAHLAGLDAKEALSKIEKRGIALRDKAQTELDHLSSDLSEALARFAKALRGETSPSESSAKR